MCYFCECYLQCGSQTGCSGCHVQLASQSRHCIWNHPAGMATTCSTAAALARILYMQLPLQPHVDLHHKQHGSQTRWSSHQIMYAWEWEKEVKGKEVPGTALCHRQTPCPCKSDQMQEPCWGSHGGASWARFGPQAVFDTPSVGDSE